MGCSTTSSSTARDDGASKALEAWANGRYTLSPGFSCTGLEVHMFAARSATCWKAKSRTEKAPVGARLFPRFELIVADHGSADVAARRLARFHDVPTHDDATTKAYPLRAGFQLGHRVVIVTTDAQAFSDEVDQVAAELLEQMGGSKLTCWRACSPR
jgi:hypothetical protein